MGRRRPRYIETLARRGYRFLGEVEVIHEPVKPTSTTLPAIETDDLEGRSVSRYLVLDKLGRGGMGGRIPGQGPQAQANRSSEVPAREEYSKHPKPLERFHQEARTAY